MSLIGSSTVPGKMATARAVRLSPWERVMDLLRWLWYFVYLQVLFVLGCLVGLVLGGIFPSLFAAIEVAKGLAKSEGDNFAGRRFWTLYRRYFWKSQQIGYLGGFILLVGASDVVYFNQLQPVQPWAFQLKLLWLGITCYLSLAISVVAPTFVDYRVPLRQFPRLLGAGIASIQAMAVLMAGGCVLLLGLYWLTGLFVPVVIGASICLLAFASRIFEQRRAPASATAH